MRVVLFVLAVMAVAFVYLPVLQSDFVNWDDPSHLLENHLIKDHSFDGVKRIFASAINKTYIPLTILSFAIEHHFFGHNPFVYHLNNLVLHLCVVGLIFLFLRMIGASFVSSLMAMIFFGIHPMHVESVAWITERKDVLYAFFYMLSVCCYVKYVTMGRQSPVASCRSGVRFYVLSVMLGLASMLAKPMALSLPLILFLLDWFLKRKISLKLFLEKIPYILYIIPIGWLTYSLNARVPIQNIFEAPLIWIWTFVFYLQKFVFPVLLVPIYSLAKPVSLLNLDFSLSLLVFCMMFLSLVVFRRNRFYLFAWGFYVLSIFFLMRFDDKGDTTIVADRFMYLPSVGFCLLIGILVEQLLMKYRTKIFKTVVFVFVAGIVWVASFKTSTQILVWKDAVTLWRYQLKYFPDTPIGLNNLATACARQKGYGVMIQDYLRVAAQGGNAGPPRASVSQKKVQEIIRLFEKAVKLCPGYIDAYYNYGSFLMDIMDYPKAIWALQTAIALHPTHADAFFNLGSAYIKIGRPYEAIDAFLQVINLDPDNEDSYLYVLKAYDDIIQKGMYANVYAPAREDVKRRHFQFKMRVARNMVRKYTGQRYFHPQ